MKRAVLALIAVFAAVVLSAGCYGGKLVKMPINAEHASLQTDSLRARQLRMLRTIANLERQLQEEREARIRYQAQSSLTIADLDETIRILISRLEDNTQLLWSGRTTRENQQLTQPSGNDPTQLPDTNAAADSATAPRRPPAALEADQLYRTSFMDLTRGNYDLAVEGFKNYLVRHPTGAHLPEVHYYLGECYYAGDRYLEAVGEFQYVVREFPDSRLVPAAYLKSGLCYDRLEEKNLAERAFRELIDNFPDSEEAEQARDMLNRFGG